MRRMWGSYAKLGEACLVCCGGRSLWVGELGSELEGEAVDGKMLLFGRGWE